MPDVSSNVFCSAISITPYIELGTSPILMNESNNPAKLRLIDSLSFRLLLSSIKIAPKLFLSGKISDNAS